MQIYYNFWAQLCLQVTTLVFKSYSILPQKVVILWVVNVFDSTTKYPSINKGYL